MKPAFGLLCLALLTAGANAQPAITTGGIVNAASYAQPGMPNSGVAQGSFFSIFGTGLGPASTPTLAFPLATTLGGVSIAVTQGATTVAAIPVFLSAGQVNAIMPSNAPLGADMVTLTYQGQTSVPVTVQVVASSFGIFTVSGLGGGQGSVTNTANQLITYAAPAHPGDTLILWGTGLGPISGNDVNPPPVGNIAASSPSLYVGGVAVTPAYHGRSGCCSALDQISFQVPAGVAGCSVPVAVQTGNTVSNFTSIAVAQAGAACSDPTGIAAGDIATLGGKGTANVGRIILQAFNLTSPGFSLLGGGNSVNIGHQQLASFAKLQFKDATDLAPVLNPGACSVYTFKDETSSVPGLLASTGLDAGAAITLSGGGSQGQLTESTSTAGQYSSRFQLTNGTSYTLTGPGGKDVGAFTVTLPLTQPGLAWSNESGITTIQRASGVNVTWTGADPNGTVQITGSSVAGTSAAKAFGAGFSCTAPGGAGQFTVPATVLLALPPSANLNTSLLNISSGSLGIGTMTMPVAFTAAGLDLGQAFSQSVVTNSTVLYQ